MISISLCMIVKNESETLGRCLLSYQDLFDEIIIVDTGSTDNTKDIAYKFTDKVYDFKWIDDFSAARNYSFSLATCDYIFCADADEILDSKNKSEFLKLKQVILPEIDIVQMKYVEDSYFSSVYNSKKELRPKLFKRLRTFTWVSPIHETINLEPVVFDSDIEIIHRPTSSHTKRDFQTFVKALNRGEILLNYVVNMFCKEVWISADDSDLIALKDTFETYMTAYDSPECFHEVNCVLAKIYRTCGDYKNFFKYALREVADNPSSEICLELGNYYSQLGDNKEAIMWYINASSETSSILDIHSSKDHPLYALSDCYKKLALTEFDPVLCEQYRKNAIEYKKMADSFHIPDEI